MNQLSRSAHSLVTTSIVTIGMLTPLFASAQIQEVSKECRRTIIFLPQNHSAQAGAKAPSDLKRLDEISKSQLKIGKYILAKGSEVSVFTESLFNNTMLPEYDRRPKELQMWGRELPDILNAERTWESLNEKEKTLLTTSTATVGLLAMGKIPILRKTLPDKAAHDELFKKTNEFLKANAEIRTDNEEGMDLLFRDRDVSAINEIVQFFNEHPSEKEAILVFGGRHNLPEFAKHAEGLCIKVPDEFASDFRPLGYKVRGYSGAQLKGSESSPDNSDRSKAGPKTVISQ